MKLVDEIAETIKKMLSVCGENRAEVTAEHLCEAYKILDSGDDGGDGVG